MVVPIFIIAVGVFLLIPIILFRFCCNRKPSIQIQPIIDELPDAKKEHENEDNNNLEDEEEEDEEDDSEDYDDEEDDSEEEYDSEEEDEEEEFDEDKRMFGKFKCSKCKKRWNSAHAYYNITQGCKTCKIDVYAFKLQPLKRNSKKKNGSDKHHIQELCGKCAELGENCSLRNVYDYSSCSDTDSSY